MPPIRRKRAPRRPRNNRKPRMGGRMGRSAGPSLAPSGRGQFASIVETITDGNADNYLPNTLYPETFTLANFDRAKALAVNFQYYRAKSVTYTYEPLYNTFQEGSTGTKPYLYLMMNRTQIIYGGGLAQIQHSGGRPKPFTSLFKTTYTPNWCSPGLIATDNSNPVNGAAQLGSQKQYQWLACPTSDPGAANGNDVNDSAINSSNLFTEPIHIITNNVKYNGHLVFIDQPGSTAPIARVTIQVHWEFKGAHFRPSKGTST